MAVSPSSQDKRRLGHLLRRAGFGTRPGEWDEYAALGLAGATRRLLHPETVPDNLAEVLSSISGDYVDFDNLESIKQWWLYRMVHTRRPLEEKMTLFWHNHFATANYKVNNPRWMWQQNELFRRYALGNFRSLLQEITRDPAMLIWLDGGQNRNGQPNENFGRELLELFTMGVGSGYTEQDIQEGARALTGWRYDDSGGTFLFDPYLHDDGAKSFLGHTGNFYSDDIIDIVVRQPATARFLGTKLFKFFVHDDPAPADLTRLQQVYFKSGYDVRAVVESIFTSPVFYSEAAFYARIKSPVEFAISAMRTMDAPMSAAGPLYEELARMGQDLFNPPNVKGWLEGREWINTRTLLARVNFATRLSNEMSRRGALQALLTGLPGGATAAKPDVAMETPPAMMTAPAMAATSMSSTAMGSTMMTAPAEVPEAAAPEMRAPAGHGATGLPAATSDQVVMAVWDALLPGHDPSARTRALLIGYLEAGSSRGKTRWDARLPGLVNLIVAAPEYQLI